MVPMSGTALNELIFSRGEAGVAEVVRLIFAHGHLEVRSLDLDDPRRDLVRIGEAFGELVNYGSNDEPCIELTNRAETPAAERNSAVEWHQDDIHTEAPVRFTLLYGIEAPTDPPPTRFADLTRAYADLDPSVRDAVRDLRVRHDPLGGNVGTAEESFGRYGHQAVAKLSHPLTRRHPGTGLRQLFALAGTATGIVGMPDGDGQRLLKSLKAHATERTYQASVQVRPGTLLIWDNIGQLHTGSTMQYSNEDGERRRVLRVSVH